MVMPGRNFTNGDQYRYGFNGQEKDDDVASGLTTAMYWEYDSRIARRWNVDPVVNVQESPYLCFSGNPIWLSDENGDTPGDSIKMRVIDKNGIEVFSPTVINLSCYNARNVPGMKCVGDNRVEVTPGTYYVEYIPYNTSLVNTFIQNKNDVQGGNLYTWNPGSPPSSPPPPPVPITQFNDLITNVQPLMGLAANGRAINLPALAFNQTDPSGATSTNGLAITNQFVNPLAARATIRNFVNNLRAAGARTATINISTILGRGSPDAVWGNAANVISARARTVRNMFRGTGINVTVNGQFGQRAAQVTINARVAIQIGWNITTQAMQRQNLNGTIAPNSTIPVPGVQPAITPQIGGLQPIRGNYTGPWRLIL